mmetsp:Transcript_30174/g.93111  ORF Transcript_30174/g.93111 Transcript_30174/m.93111 type:complete len:299 (+) Transcript_30174:602-1498(+)
MLRADVEDRGLHLGVEGPAADQHGARPLLRGQWKDGAGEEGRHLRRVAPRPPHARHVLRLHPQVHRHVARVRSVAAVFDVPLPLRCFHVARGFLPCRRKVTVEFHRGVGDGLVQTFGPFFDALSESNGAKEPLECHPIGLRPGAIRPPAVHVPQPHDPRDARCVHETMVLAHRRGRIRDDVPAREGLAEPVVDARLDTDACQVHFRCGVLTQRFGDRHLRREPRPVDGDELVERDPRGGEHDAALVLNRVERQRGVDKQLVGEAVPGPHPLHEQVTNVLPEHRVFKVDLLHVFAHVRF